MGCQSSRIEPTADEAKQATTLLVHHVARRPPQPWEEELCCEMMSLLGKTSSPIKLSPRDVRRFAVQFCYSNLHDTSDEVVQRCVRRALQINRALQHQGFRFFRVVLAEKAQGSMTGSVLKGLVLRSAEEVGTDRIRANPLSTAFSGRSIELNPDAEDSDDEDDCVIEDVTDDLDSAFAL